MPVVLDPNIQKTAVRLDANGNEIDPKTKQIIKPKESEYVPPKADDVPQTDSFGRDGMSINPIPKEEARKDLSIAEQIEQAEKHLADLKVLKKQEIERMKAELAKLEATE